MLVSKLLHTYVRPALFRVDRWEAKAPGASDNGNPPTYSFIYWRIFV